MVKRNKKPLEGLVQTGDLYFHMITMATIWGMDHTREIWKQDQFGDVLSAYVREGSGLE